MNKIATIAGLAVAVTAMTASAEVAYSVDIDEAYSGDAGVNLVHGFSMGAVDSIDSISMELSSSWGGDFIITLVSDMGASYSLMNVEGSGIGIGADFEMGLTGDGSLGDVATYNFVEMGAADFPLEGFGNGYVAPGTFNADGWTAGAIAAANWTLTVEDATGGDAMAVGNFTINATIPAPGALALLGLGGIAAGRRRRA